MSELSKLYLLYFSPFHFSEAVYFIENENNESADSFAQICMCTNVYACGICVQMFVYVMYVHRSVDMCTSVYACRLCVQMFVYVHKCVHLVVYKCLCM